MKQLMMLSEKQLKMVHCVFGAAAVWSSSYWVLGTNYNTYVVLWGCLVKDDGTIRSKFTADSNIQPAVNNALCM
jgi:hypothetical protein